MPLLDNLNEELETSYVLFKLSKETNKIKNFLDNNKKGFYAINYADIYQNFGEDFIACISEINKNNQSQFWWALNFTNKNPITTNLCNRVFNYLVILRLLKKRSNLIIITDDAELYLQTRKYLKNRGVTVVNAITSNHNPRRSLASVLPLAILFGYLRSLILKFETWRITRKVKFYKNKGYSVFLSLINHQSFSKEGTYCDAYFGSLPNYFKKLGITFLIIGEVLFPPYSSVLKKAVNNTEDFLIVSKEYFLSLSNLTVCLFRALIHFLKPIRIRGAVSIDGVDIGDFVKKSIKEDYVSTKFFSNICFYYCMQGLAGHVKVSKFYYPFENRSFEKMSILALRKYSKKTKIIGYQHASISLRHTNLFLGKDESKITPLPDSIITMGEITRNILKNEGNFPENLLKVGCALRQRLGNNSKLAKKGKINNILVTLATNIEEYVKVLRILDENLKSADSYNLWIRPHPVFSLEDAIEITGQPRFKFHKADNETLQKCYEWADLVLYVHSTLSLEALSKGIPVINLKVPDCLNPDPLFDFSALRWVIDEKTGLIGIVSQIENLSTEEFLKHQQEAQEYTRKYIRPATEENMKVFLNE